ncbi:Alpha/beta hydrolase fold-1 [Macleaya cordata]|uniref:soluble epoxide hydrolase n=1 Tax=Macleaya cordata TaxID=56857 RepID=A0A200QSI4_MACCD|nr:Alpha/beta hydrolase fold-1 [Macleaya cordata]
MVEVNGINMHVAEKGEGPVVLFLHGFPELWYSWRHQIVALAARGYRAVAPDLRGYGDTDAPTSINSYTYCHIVGDIIALINTLGVEQVFLVGHDWGAIIAWYLCLFRPDRVKALVNLSVAFNPRHPSKKPIERLRTYFGDNYYICRFQEPGQAEAEYATANTANLFKNMLTFRKTGPLIVPKEKGFGALPDTPVTLPSWLSEEDINYYANKFDQKGFTGGLNYYRALDLNWELTAPWTEVQVKVPVKFIVGDQDLTYTTPGAKEYIHGDGFKRDVPLLQEVVIMEGVAHFINEEKPDEINEHIYDFITKF